MNEGYVVGDGDKYYCSDECLYVEISPEEWKENYLLTVGEDKSCSHYGDEDYDQNEVSENSSSYWTAWEEPEYFEIIIVDGIVYKIDELETDEDDFLVMGKCKINLAKIIEEWE